jgi:hypothetical protein
MLQTPNKDGGWIIVVKETGERAAGTKEYDDIEEAAQKLRELEGG